MKKIQRNKKRTMIEKFICKNNLFTYWRFGKEYKAMYKHLVIGEIYEFEVKEFPHIINYTLLNTAHKETGNLNGYRYGLDFRSDVKDKYPPGYRGVKVYMCNDSRNDFKLFFEPIS